MSDAGRVLAGIFIKTPVIQQIEIAADAGVDFCVLDSEHAPMDLRAIDQLAGIARAIGMPCLTRIPDHSAAFVSACLDLGCAGVLAPRVQSAAAAAQLVAAAKFSSGRRGFSPSPRAFGYGSSTGRSAREAADRASTVWVQIEDAAGVANAAAIAATPGVDCVFIGPTDLAADLGAETAADPKVREAVAKIASAGRAAGVRVAAFASGADEIRVMLDAGVTIFVCGSDQAAFRAGARQAAEAVRQEGSIGRTKG
jgi:2-keto-3-deoxy-L-rhamnonate aldolase RhmA